MGLGQDGDWLGGGFGRQEEGVGVEWGGDCGLSREEVSEHLKVVVVGNGGEDEWEEGESFVVGESLGEGAVFWVAVQHVLGGQQLCVFDLKPTLESR